MKRIAFEQEELSLLAPTAKVAMAATVNGQGQPHLTLITSMMAKDAAHMMWGEFSVGLSKKHVLENPKTGFLIMTLDRKLWRGKATWTHKASEGEDYVQYNQQPMFRYNAYFGINTVHYLDLLFVTEQEGLPLARVIPASLLTLAAKSGARRRDATKVLRHYSRSLLEKVDTLKFLSYVGDDGYPEVVPLLQCQVADDERLVFSPFAYGELLQAIPDDADVAIFGLTLGMESVMTRGVFKGYRRYRGVRLGAVDLNYVYNSMPPGHGQVYPEVPLEAVREF